MFCSGWSASIGAAASGRCWRWPRVWSSFGSWSRPCLPSSAVRRPAGPRLSRCRFCETSSTAPPGRSSSSSASMRAGYRARPLVRCASGVCCPDNISRVSCCLPSGRASRRRLPWRCRGPVAGLPGATGAAVSPCSFWSGSAGTIIAQNLAFLSEPKVLSARYLAVAWPLLAFVPLLVSRALLPRWPCVVAAVFCLGFMVPLSLAPVNYAAWSGPLPKLSNAHRVVIDCPRSLAVPRTVWFGCPAMLSSTSTTRRDLQARPAAWLGQLQSGDFIVHGDDIPPVALQLLRTRFVITEVPPHFRHFLVYRVGTPHPGGSPPCSAETTSWARPGNCLIWRPPPA